MRLLYLDFLDLILSVPLFIQDYIVESLCIMLTAYLMWIDLILYRIYPFLAVVPILMALAFVHFSVKSGSRDNISLKLKGKVLPVIFDTDEIFEEVTKEKPKYEAVVEGIKVHDVLNMTPRADLWDFDDNGEGNIYDQNDIASSSDYSHESEDDHFGKS